MNMQFSDSYFLISDHPFEDIYGREWVNELHDVIKNNKSIEDFIVSKDTKQKEQFIAKVLNGRAESMKNYNQRIDDANTKILKLQEEKRIREQLSLKIDNISSLLPKNKQALFQKAVSECFNNSSTVTLLLAPKKGFIGKLNTIINNKKINTELTGMMQYMKDNNVIEKAKESSLLQAIISGENTHDELSKLEASIAKEQDTISKLSEAKSRLEKANNEDINRYDIEFKHDREIENNNIREFVKQKGV